MSTKLEDDPSRRKLGDNSSSSNNNPACDQCRTRKIRCDRELPTCSNCRKANYPCDFTNKGKRINHTKQLVEDFSFLSGRLESIDASIARITQRLDLDSFSIAAEGGINPDQSTPADDLNHFIKQSSPSIGADTNEAQNGNVLGLPGRNTFHITRNQDGTESYHGPTAGRSLFQETRIFVDNLLNTSMKQEDENAEGQEDDYYDEDLDNLKKALANDTAAQAELQSCNDTFPFPRVTPSGPTTSDGRLVSRPPQSFVESALEFFLEEINTVLPLFDEQHLRAAVKEQYASVRTPATDAWNLCFNNIIVLVMGTKLKTALSMNVRRRDLEDDIFLPFLSNSHRAYLSLCDYSAPRLINVQALITLALVAAEHFPFGAFEKLVQMACALGREMGLERYVESRGNPLASSTKERRIVFWALYVLDKRRTFTTGKPCELYLAESDLEVPKDVQDEVWAQNALARIHMMSIWEEIWKSLYSCRAMRNSPRFREEQIDRLRKYLKNWVTHHKPILCKPEQVEMGSATCMRLELRYSFHVAQILVHRCIDRPSNLQQQINNARAALKIIADIAKGPATVGGTALLSRIFRTYPILAFTEIHKRTIFHIDDESKEDMELLRTCIDTMNVFKSTGVPEVYFNRLGAGLDWCMKIANVLRKVQDSPSAQPMERQASTTRPAALLARKSTSKRSSESFDVTTTIPDQRMQRRRTTPNAPTLTGNPVGPGTVSRESSSNSSTGPDTPVSSYFSEFNQIDPLAVEQTPTTMGLSHLPTPSNVLSSMQELAIQNPSTSGISLASTSVPDNKDPFGLNFAFNYTAPSGTINPTIPTNQTSPQLATNPLSPKSSVNDLSSIVARLPPEGQQALTSIPPGTEYAPGSFSAFNTDLLDDSFINVDHHPDLAGNQPSSFSHFNFDFASEYQNYGGPMEMAGTDGF